MLEGFVVVEIFVLGTELVLVIEVVNEIEVIVVVVIVEIEVDLSSKYARQAHT